MGSSVGKSGIGSPGRRRTVDAVEAIGEPITSGISTAHMQASVASAAGSSTKRAPPSRTPPRNDSGPKTAPSTQRQPAAGA